MTHDPSLDETFHKAANFCLLHDTLLRSVLMDSGYGIVLVCYKIDDLSHPMFFCGNGQPADQVKVLNLFTKQMQQSVMPASASVN